MQDTPDGTHKRSSGIVLAFDFGLRRIGVAAGNNVTQSATALQTLSATDGQPTWTEVDRLIAEWLPAVLVVGQPTGSSATSIVARARDFSMALEERYRLPVVRIDEAFTSTTAAAELKQARRAGQRSRRVNKELIDSHAARLIAEQYLNAN